MCAKIYSTRRKLLLDCLTERGRLENRKKPDVNQSISRKSAICLNEKKRELGTLNVISAVFDSICAQV